MARAFYARHPLALAPELLNKVLVRQDPEQGRLSGRIVEVEAYCGGDDPASHAYRGRTARNGTMFGPGGHLYVYFTYGMHFCANVVCGPEGTAGAVLVRALAPLEPIEPLRARRSKARRDVDLCSGPAKLCQALGIDRGLDGTDLVRGPDLVLVDDGVAPPAQPRRTPRVGIREAVDRRWRFAVPGDPNVGRAQPARTRSSD